MSATGRSDVRQEGDYYSTPSWATEAICDVLFAVPFGCPRPLVVLDPAAGEGAILDVVGRYGAREKNGVELVGLEIDPRRGASSDLTSVIARSPAVGFRVEIGDALDPKTDEHWRHADLAIFNPPFSHAFEFLERGMSLCSTGAVLLRLGMLAGQKRFAFWRENSAAVYVLPRRPGFLEHLAPNDGELVCGKPIAKKSGKAMPCDRVLGHEGVCLTIGTDAADYAWIVWGMGDEGRWGVLDTPKPKRVASPKTKRGA